MRAGGRGTAGRGATLQERAHIAAFLALALAAPCVAAAAPVGTYALIDPQPGDQTDPSIDAQYVVYASWQDPADGWDVMLYDLTVGPPARPIAAGPGDQDQPDVYRTTVAYRTAAGIVVVNWEIPATSRTPRAARRPRRSRSPRSPTPSPRGSAAPRAGA